MMGLRRSTASRFGASLAGLALGVQLVVASWGLAPLASGAADSFAEHALCLAGDGGKSGPAPPATPAPAHVHDGLCCLWHAMAGIEPLAAAAPQPVAYGEITPAALADAAVIPGPQRGPANARAPPTLA